MAISTVYRPILLFGARLAPTVLDHRRDLSLRAAHGGRGETSRRIKERRVETSYWSGDGRVRVQYWLGQASERVMVKPERVASTADDSFVILRPVTAVVLLPDFLLLHTRRAAAGFCVRGNLVAAAAGHLATPAPDAQSASLFHHGSRARVAA